MRRRISRAPQTKNWCVGFSFPPPAYAGIHPTLYLFGFRANALNSHSPPYLPGSGLGRFAGLSGADLRAPKSGPAGTFRAPSGSGGLRGVQGPPGGLWGFEAPCGQDVGFGSGFRVFWAPSPTPAWQAFPSHFQGGLARSGLMPPQQDAEGQGRWV